MPRLESQPRPFPTSRETEIDYLFDMIAQLAKLARHTGEPVVAIHLEAILAAHHATALKASA